MASVNRLISAAAVFTACFCSSMSSMACPERAPAYVKVRPGVATAAAKATTPPAPAEIAVGTSQDPNEFLADLSARYRALTAYEDTAHLVQVSSQSGRQLMSQELDLVCAFHDDQMSVTTPARQVARSTGLKAPVQMTPAMKELARKYDLRLAPHLALRVADDPLADLMPGVEESLSPASLTRVTVDGRDLIRIELRASEGRDGDAAMQLDVDAQSMLVRRIQSYQVLPDGARYESTLDITPTRVESASAPPPAHAPIASSPTDTKPAAARTRTASTPKPEATPAQPGAVPSPTNPTGRAASTPPEK